MKKLIVLICLTITFANVLAYDIPKPIGYINDYGNLLTEQEENQLNQLLKSHEDSTSNQIAVLTLPSFDDREEGPLFDFSMAVFNDWKIGKKGKNNGILFVIVKNLASKNAPGLRIVTGYGAEGPLPDGICKRIIEQARPNIKSGNYYTGISNALNSMILRMGTEFSKDTEEGMSTFNIFIIVLVILILIYLIIKCGISSDGSSVFFSSSDSSGSSNSFFDGFSGGDSGGGGAGD